MGVSDDRILEILPPKSSEQTSTSGGRKLDQPIEQIAVAMAGQADRLNLKKEVSLPTG